jgi:para-nitrobenzyl esterase
MLLFTAFDPTYQHLDRAGARRRVESRLGDVADEALAAYEALRPGATPAQLVAALQTDETFRAPAWTLADRRAAAGAPTWMYWFTWASPAFDGALGSCHGLDIPFAFHNLARPGVEAFTGSGDDRAAVADAFADAVLAFARTGDPGWPAYDTIDRPTWRIDAEPELLHDPEGELRALWAGTRVGG